MPFADESVLKLLRGAVKKENLPLDQELERLAKIISKIEAVRKPAYKAAKDLLFDTSASVAKAATDQTAKEFNLQLRMARQKAREERFCKTLSKDQLDAILSGQGIDGATIEDWFDRWRRGDLEKLAGLVRKASVESLTVADITRAARGSITSKAPEYHSLLLYPKVDAARMARTIINGVSNNARAETIQANSDVIDGVRFVGTLDGKTCPYCAAYDGYIWRGEDMASARRPPIHPNCRCTLVPVVELKDADGNPIELVDEEGKSVEERPAANADFDQLAKDAYNAQAKEKGWNRRWDDLAASTRLKYYYQAQKDYEAKTGKPAYRQVPSSMTFKEYFDKQDDAFKKAWLGAKAFEEYKSGDLSEATREKLLFKPNLSYQVNPETLIGWQKGYNETEALIEELEKAAAKKVEELKAEQLEKEKKELEEKAANDPVYTFEEYVWKADAGDLGFKHAFVYGDETKLDAILADASWSVFEWLEKNFQAVQDFEDVIVKKKPLESDYFSKENYEKAVSAWEDEKKRYAAFKSAFIDNLHAARNAREDAERKAIKGASAPLSVQFEGYGIWSQGATPEWFNGLTIEQLNALKALVPSAFETLNDDHGRAEPKSEDFFAPKNYETAQKQWNDAGKKITSFRTDVENAINARIKELEEQANKASERETLLRVETDSRVYEFARGDEERLAEILKNASRSDFEKIMEATLEAAGGEETSLDDFFANMLGENTSSGKEQALEALRGELLRVQEERAKAERDEIESYETPLSIDAPGFGKWEEKTVPEWVVSLTEEQLSTAREAAFKAIDELEKEHKGRKPNEEAFFSPNNFKIAEKNWERRLDNIKLFKEFADEVLKAKATPPFNNAQRGTDVARQENDDAVSLSEQCLLKIDEMRIKGGAAPDVAKALEKRAESVLYCSKYSAKREFVAEKEALLYEKKQLGEEKKHNAGRLESLNSSRYRTAKDLEEIEKLSARQSVVERRLSEIKSRLEEKEQDSREKEIERQVEILKTYETRDGLREEADAIIQALFPDNSGKELFTERKKTSIIKEPFEKNRQGNAARSVFSYYDVLSRHFNTGGRTIAAPKIDFERVDSQGGFDHRTGELNISSDYYSGGRDETACAECFAHELGHWLELWGLGCERAQKNYDWLEKEQGAGPIPRAIFRDSGGLEVPRFKQPNLTAKESNYAQKIYGNERPIPRERKGYTKDVYDSTELMSVGLEFLYKDPETFIRRHPKHFWLIIENLKGLRIPEPSQK